MTSPPCEANAAPRMEVNASHSAQVATSSNSAGSRPAETPQPVSSAVQPEVLATPAVGPAAIEVESRTRAGEAAESVTLINHHRHHHVEVDQIVDVTVPMEQEEFIQVPKIIPQKRIIQQHVEQVVEMPISRTQEEIVHVPKVGMQERIVQQQVETTMEMPTHHDDDGEELRCVVRHVIIVYLTIINLILLRGFTKERRGVRGGRGQEHAQIAAAKTDAMKLGPTAAIRMLPARMDNTSAGGSAGMERQTCSRTRESIWASGPVQLELPTRTLTRTALNWAGYGQSEALWTTVTATTTTDSEPMRDVEAFSSSTLTHPSY